MTQIADLHTHSTASDGQYTPSELAEKVKARGIEVWALTDHDTMDGIAEAERAAQALGIRFIRGVELSAKEYHTFHILGYGYREGDTPLAAFCRDMKRKRGKRETKIIAYLNSFGFELTEAEVEALAGGQIIGRPHFAQAMVERGYVANRREAFDQYLDTDDYHKRVETEKPGVRECIAAIKSSGGIVSLAHPYQIGIGDAALDRLVGELKEIGLDAIECHYPKFTPEMTALYLKLAEKYRLHVTGGSDFHGERVKPDVELAAWEMDAAWIKGA